MTARKVGGAALALCVALAAAATLAGPRIGQVLAFTVIAVKDDGPSKAWEIVAEIDPAAGTPDDFAATAVAIARAVPHDNVVVSIERSDLPPSAGSWRRTLARAEYRTTDSPEWTVNTAEPPRSKSELLASIDYSERVGLALTGEGEPMPSDTDEALVKELAAKHGVSPARVMTFTPLFRERGARWGWLALDGPGSEHLAALKSCLAKARPASDAWKACR